MFLRNGVLTTLIIVILASGCVEESKKLSPPKALNNPSKNLSTHPQWRYLSSQYMDSNYTIGPEDLLNITVFGAEEFNREVRVNHKGSFTFPLIGSVYAEGRTVEQLEQALASMLSEKYLKDPQVSVFVEQYKSKKVAIVGHVVNPQIVKLTRNRSTLFEVLGMVGGLGEKAGKVIYVIRPAEVVMSTLREARAGQDLGQAFLNGGQDEEIIARIRDEVIPINVVELMEYRNPMSNMEIMPGDIISVPQGEYFFILGEVNKPGAYATREGLTALQAISFGGKFSPIAKYKDVRLLRRQPAGEVQIASLNIKKIAKGEEEDILIEPGDVLLVGKSTLKTVALQAAQVANVALNAFTNAYAWDFITKD
ncbi:MAG: polysaccharide biosynthesis/export family protein [Candidatus Brocadiales bacterium]